MGAQVAGNLKPSLEVLPALEQVAVKQVREALLVVQVGQARFDLTIPLDFSAVFVPAAQ